MQDISSLTFVCTALTALPVSGWAAQEPTVKCIHKPEGSPSNPSDRCLSTKDTLTVWGKRAAFTSPVSATRISAQDMQAYRMQTLGDVAERVPNLSFTIPIFLSPTQRPTIPF
ncbi:hypothetical protein MKW11_13100 [Gluconobacter frateurii]|uniref:hypothetical protein n=1 Tax=Gluconobacter frateurii TaxID=38308 RepID=UPI001F064971|nr:hypothetical protein [Gluconobacter frateurii]UMM08113.1 hypothetical protein MKW11_13100 [Gluconobacter frateurii]